MRETTALGAAIAAGLAVGLWRNFAELRNINRAGGAVFEPSITREESAIKFREWEKAVRMSKGWIESNSPEETVPKPRAHDAKANGRPKLQMESPSSSRPETPLKTGHTSLIADVMAAAGAGAALKVKSRTANGDTDFPPSKTPLISISGDLEDADEEDLFLELRKIEILQKLKKLRKLKLSYY